MCPVNFNSCLQTLKNSKSREIGHDFGGEKVLGLGEGLGEIWSAARKPIDRGWRLWDQEQEIERNLSGEWD